MNNLEILAKTFLVYGIQTTGKSAVNFLLSRGAKTVYIYDDGPCEQVKDAIIIKDFDQVKNLGVDCCILSPGVNVLGNKNIELLEKLNIPYISEFCLGLTNAQGKNVCITGTNGKTTTTNLIYELLRTQNKEIFLCGNRDIPLTHFVNQTTKNSILVCEVSSFALESVSKEFKPQISSILNITTDHISRHKTFENYKNIKFNITKNQNKNDYFICEYNFKVKTNAKVLTFSLSSSNANIYCNKNYIIYGNKRLLKISKIKLLGEKNLENVMCATLIAKLFGISNRNIKKVVYSFKAPSHRMEEVCNINGIKFIDDSKATNPDATICALKSFKKNVILLLGGSDKGYCYDEIFSYTQNVKNIITFGKMSEKIYLCAKKHNFDFVVKYDKFFDAVCFAKKISKKGDVVLLSPACASFDEFSSYKQRGDEFKKIIKGENEKTKN